MRWQLPALGTVGVVLWFDALLGDDLAGSVPCLALVACLAFLAGWHTRLPGLVATGLVVAGLLTVADQVASPGEFSFANDGVFYAVVVLAPGLAGWLLGTRTRQLGELRQRTAELQGRRADSLAAVRATEAERVERQIDAALAERVEQIIAEVRRADDLAASDPDAARVRVARVEETAREALAELREVLGVLQPTPPRPPEEPTKAQEASPPARSRPLDRYDVLLLLAVLPLAVETSQAGRRGPIWLNVAACLGQGTALLLVRRRPLAGAVALFSIAAAQTAWLTPLPPTVSWALPGLLVPFLAAVALPRRTAPLGLALALLGLGTVALATPDAQRALDGFLPSAVMIVLSWWAGRSAAVRETRAAELRQVLGELARARDAQVRLAASEQRAEMARDLHDVGAHTLTVVCLQAGAAQKLWAMDPDQARSALSALRELAEDSLSHLGGSLGGLLADDSQNPLDPAALDVLKGLGKVLGLDVAIDVSGEPRELDETVARAAFRVVQESLTNAARHASPGTVQIRLEYTPDTLEVRVSDSGPGPRPGTAPIRIHGSGAGLRGMRERVEACHGDLSFGSFGPGFAVHARLPHRAVT